MATTLDLGNVVGPKGEKGSDGATWLNGAAVPTAAQGKDGDFYLNTANYDIYSKASGNWVKIGNIKGASGVPGASTDLTDSNKLLRTDDEIEIQLIL